MRNTRAFEGPNLERIDPVSHGRFADLATTPEGRLLLQQIMSSSGQEPLGTVVSMPRTRKPQRWVAAVAAVAALLVAIVMLQLPKARVAGAVEFREEGDYIEAIIVDPHASKTELETAFADHGFSIEVQLLPTSPSLEGKVLGTTEDSAAQKHASEPSMRPVPATAEGEGSRVQWA